MCLVDGHHDIVPPIIPETQEFVHFNTLWCYLFHKLTGEEKEDKGIDAFKIIPSKGLTISALLDRVFPAIAATDNKPLQFVNTKTVAYIFALTIYSVTIFQRESPHSRRCLLKNFDQSSATLSPLSTRTSSCEPALGDVL